MTIEYRKIASGEEARKAIISGIDKMAETVKSTLGPNGKTVIIEQNLRSPIATKDGVTVAQNIVLGNPMAKMGADILKEVANNANNQVGDGTTTATVMVQALLKALNEIPSSSNMSNIRKGMEDANNEIQRLLIKKSIDIRKRKDPFSWMASIAAVSSNHDKEIVDKVIEAFKHTKEQGAIKVDLGKKHYTTVHKTEGLIYDVGMVSANFANNAKKTVGNYEDAYVFLTDMVLDNINPLQEIFEKARTEQKPILVMASDFTEPAMMTFYRMKDMYGVKVVCVKAPGFGSQKEETLKDIGYVTGAKPFLKGQGIEMEEISGYDPEEFLGKADRITAGLHDLAIIGGKGGKDAIEGRIEYLKEKMAEEEDGYLKDQLSGRIAKLTDGVAVIFVGAHTEFDAQEKKDRYVDAVKAVKAAMKAGVVPGGGVALLEIADVLENNYKRQMVNDFDIGFWAVVDAIKQPWRQILINAELDPEEFYPQILKSKFKKGYNVLTQKFENFINSGIIDPTLVPSLSVNNAVSIVGTLVSTAHVIYNFTGEEENY